MAGFRWAYNALGEPLIKEFAPASAFSEGDPLMINTNASTVSGVEIVSVPDIVAVALADSTDSVNGLVPCIMPGANDVWISTLTPAGSLVTIGSEVDIQTDGAQQGGYYTGISAKTVRLVMIDYALDQSTQSQAQVRFIYHNSNIDVS